RLGCQETHAVEQGAYAGNDASPDRKHVANLGIGDQVHISVSVAHLDVAQAMPLLRRRPERLAQQTELLDPDAWLAPFGRAHAACLADQVAGVQPEEPLMRDLAENVPLGAELDASSGVLQLGGRQS